MRVREKKDRATSEQVLDPRTRLILYKMLNREVIMEINGCISTGKEVRTHGTRHTARHTRHTSLTVVDWAMVVMVAGRPMCTTRWARRASSWR
jgi:serine/threonine-protein kinase RIO1